MSDKLQFVEKVWSNPGLGDYKKDWFPQRRKGAKESRKERLAFNDFAVFFAPLRLCGNLFVLLAASAD